MVCDSAIGAIYGDDNIQFCKARISKPVRARTFYGGGFWESTFSVTPVSSRQVFDCGSWRRRETVPLHTSLVASALHDVRHINAPLGSDSTSRSHGVGDLLCEACLRLHCTKVENEDLSTRLTAAPAQVDKNELEVQLLTRRVGAFEARFKAFMEMHTESAVV